MVGSKAIRPGFDLFVVDQASGIDIRETLQGPYVPTVSGGGATKVGFTGSCLVGSASGGWAIGAAIFIASLAE